MTELTPSQLDKIKAEAIELDIQVKIGERRGPIDKWMTLFKGECYSCMTFDCFGKGRYKYFVGNDYPYRHSVSKIDIDTDFRLVKKALVQENIELRPGQDDIELEIDCLINGYKESVFNGCSKKTLFAAYHAALGDAIISRQAEEEKKREFMRKHYATGWAEEMRKHTELNEESKVKIEHYKCEMADAEKRMKENKRLYDEEEPQFRKRIMIIKDLQSKLDDLM